MFSLRAPLFPVGLAFATGCFLGLDKLVSLGAALVFFYIAGVAWLVLGRHEAASRLAFYFLNGSAALVHTLLLGASISADDLRRLPEQKLLETTQWRGLIIQEPASAFSSHVSRRALDRTTFVLRVEAWRTTDGRLFGATIDAPWQPAQGDLRCTVVGPAHELRCGDRLEFATGLTPVAPPLCPGELDTPAFEAGQGIYYHATIPSLNWRRIETGGGDWWQNLSYRARDWAYDRLQLGLEDDPRTADFLAGMLIGYRQEIPTDIEQDFRRTGTLHVFAVSGQNIAEMVVVVLILLQLCGLIRWRWAWATAPIVLLYCLLTGSPASAVRATVMAMAILAAWRFGRPVNALACWSVALLAMMIWNPAVLLDAGAQLSFGIVLGLILVGPPVTRLLLRPFELDPFLPVAALTAAQRRERVFWIVSMGLLGAGIAAALVSEPITAATFHQITPISILANLVVVPAAGLITVVGTTSVAVSLVSTSVAALLNNANWFFAKLLILFVGFLAHEPGAALNVPDLRTIKTHTPFFVVAPLQDSACLLVRTQAGAWLVNTGRESPTPSTTWHLLQYYGINRLEGLVLAEISGPDNGGAETLVRDFHPHRLVVPLLRTRSPLEKEVPAITALAGHESEAWRAGQEFSLGEGVRVEVLGPVADSIETRADDRALILLFHVGDQSLLWAGRIGSETQRALLAAHPDLHADLLVMDTDSPPAAEWLRVLGVRAWFQIPPRDRQLNSVASDDVPDECKVWPLNQSGAVEIHRAYASTAGLELHPWLALPNR